MLFFRKQRYRVTNDKLIIIKSMLEKGYGVYKIRSKVCMKLEDIKILKGIFDLNQYPKDVESFDYYKYLRGAAIEENKIRRMTYIEQCKELMYEKLTNTIKNNTKYKIAKKLLNLNMDAEEVRKITGLTKKQMKTLLNYFS